MNTLGDFLSDFLDGYPKPHFKIEALQLTTGYSLQRRAALVYSRTEYTFTWEPVLNSYQENSEALVEWLDANYGVCNYTLECNYSV